MHFLFGLSSLPKTTHRNFLYKSVVVVLQVECCFAVVRTFIARRLAEKLQRQQGSKGQNKQSTKQVVKIPV